MTLYQPDNHLAVFAVVMTIVFLGFYSERFPIGRRLSGGVVALLLGVIASNLSLLPNDAPSYNVVWNGFIPLAIALYLFKADIVSIVVESGRVFIGFVFASLGVVAGAVLGSILLDLGPQTPELAAVFTGTYTGGSMNLAAVAETVELRDASLLAAVVVVDNVLFIGFIVLLSIAAGWTWFQELYRREGYDITSSVDAKPNEAPRLSAQQIALSLSIAATAVVFSYSIADYIGISAYRILVLSLLMVAIATLARSSLSRLDGAEQLASVMLVVFLTVLGAGTDLGAMANASISMILFVIILLVMHTLFLLVGGKIFRLNHGELIIASMACIGGPPVAVAYAVILGWNRLTGAAIATGVFGYAIGNFLGVSVYEIANTFR